MDTENDRDVAVKILKPTKKNFIRKEVKVLQLLKDGPNILKFVSIVRDPATKIPAIVSEYIHMEDVKKSYEKIAEEESSVKFYMQQLLKGIDYIHSQGIIHRDIKPQNVLIDHKQKKLRIIDFGSSEFYLPE